MKGFIAVSNATIERLPLYYRCLDNLSLLENREVISSSELGRRLGIQPTQVRKDLSYYGEFGRKGVGYDIRDLKKILGKIIGANKTWSAVLIGAGNLGQAIINYEGARKMGLEIIGVFDNDLNKIGNRISSITVQSIKDLSKFLTKERVEVGVIAVPTNTAQEVTDQLVELGIKGIWNFAPARLTVPENVILRNEDLSIGIGALFYHLSWSQKQIKETN